MSKYILFMLSTPEHQIGQTSCYSRSGTSTGGYFFFFFFFAPTQGITDEASEPIIFIKPDVIPAMSGPTCFLVASSSSLPIYSNSHKRRPPSLHTYIMWLTSQQSSQETVVESSPTAVIASQTIQSFSGVVAAEHFAEDSMIEDVEEINLSNSGFCRSLSELSSSKSNRFFRVYTQCLAKSMSSFIRFAKIWPSLCS